MHPSDLLLVSVRFSFVIYSHIKQEGQASDRLMSWSWGVTELPLFLCYSKAHPQITHQHRLLFLIRFMRLHLQGEALEWTILRESG